MTKQTVLGRVSQLARVNVHALLDQAENPQEMIDQLLRDYTENIHEAEDAVAAALGGLRLMEQDHAEDVAAAVEWGGKALSASRKADELRIIGGIAEADRFDNLARIAIGRQLQSEKEAKAAEPVIAAQTDTVHTLKAGLDRMKVKLSQLRDRREELVTRSRSAQQPPHALPDAVRDVNVLDPTAELGRFEEKVRREEAKARGRHELAASCLDAQFESVESLSDVTEIDARLAELKAKA
ncbi:PspA/IM30 family protein [Streptomyces sp.]|uniref:PspA/IM30 family protein n=1 Tax=Streptomyces sp. TaxID=1931 RepID=UPI002F3E9698